MNIPTKFAGPEKLADVVDEYLDWRKVNPHIKGGENYLKRLRDALAQHGFEV